ncbi:SCAR5-like protein, partial [Mya arenaria]
SSLQRNLTFLDIQIVSFCTRNRILAVQPVPRNVVMRSTLLYLMLCSTILGPIQGSRLGKLEEVVKSLRSLVYSELSSIRHEVKEISNRVYILENSTVTHDPSSPSKEMEITSYNLGDETGESGKQLVRDGNNEASVVKAESTSSDLEKEISSMKTLHDGYYYTSENDIRLANVSSYGSNGIQGRLEVRHNNIWGTVCDDSFELAQVGKQDIENNVNVVCRMFGFQECDYVIVSGMGRGSGDIWMDDVKCGGGESSFLVCPYRGWGNHNCGHDEDVGFRMWN